MPTLTLLFPPRLRGHHRGEPVAGLARSHPEVELAAVRLQVGPQAGHALPVRGVQPGGHLGRSVRAEQGAPPQCHSVWLPAGKIETKTLTRSSWDLHMMEMQPFSFCHPGQVSNLRINLKFCDLSWSFAKTIVNWNKKKKESKIEM